MNTITVEYYRCFPGNNGDSGTWNTNYIAIPADTPEDKMDAAIRLACNSLNWSTEMPVFVGLYCIPDQDDGD